MTSYPASILRPAHAGPLRANFPGPFRLGRNTSVTSNALGIAVSNSAGSNAFLHPFTPTMAGLSLSMTLGLIAGKTPTINGQPMAGPGLPTQSLTLDPSIVDANGESWVCLEVTPDAATGQLIGDFKREIVQRNAPIVTVPTVGRCALALVIFNGRVASLCVPIVFFNLQYARYMPPAGQGATQHFFL